MKIQVLALGSPYVHQSIKFGKNFYGPYLLTSLSLIIYIDPLVLKLDQDSIKKRYSFIYIFLCASQFKKKKKLIDKFLEQLAFSILRANIEACEFVFPHWSSYWKLQDNIS